MAMATAKTKTVTCDIILKLTPREAETLYVVTQYIGGSSKDSRRGDMDAIGDALCNAARSLIDGVGYPIYHKFFNGVQGITFKDDKEIK